MARILNEQTITSPISKLVELSSNYIVNGQFYSKSDLAPSPMSFAFFESSPQCEMIINQSVFNGCKLSGKITNGVMPDNCDPNISYCVKPGAYPHSDNKCRTIITKVVKDDKNVSTKSFHWIPTTDNKKSFGNIVDQDDDFLYVSMMGEDFKSQVFKLRKETMESTGVYEAGINVYISLIKATDLYLYFAITGANNYFAVAKYNKVAGTMSIIKDDTGKTGGYSSQCIIAIDPNNSNVFYAIRDGYMLNNLHHSVIKKYVLDLNTDTVGSTYVNLDLTGLTSGVSIPCIDNSISATNELFFLREEEKQFLVYVRYGEGVTVTNSSILVFEVMESETLKLIQEIALSPSIFKGCLLSDNNKTIILSNESQVRFFSWNSYSKKFENTSSVSNPVMVTGSDIDGNVLVQYADSSVDMFSSVMAIDVSANLEKETYDYNGQDIISNVIAFAQNYNGEFAATNIKLTLVGPAVFTATEENSLSITTSTVNPNVLPITITGPGYIRVTVEME